MYKDALLSSCSALESIRAIHVSSDVQNTNFRSTQSLPDVHELNGVEVSPALEYVLWEVPWMKRLYNVTREQSQGVVRLVYNGYDRLPGRPHYSELSWTNETILDHISAK